MTDNLATTIRSQMIDLPAGRFHYVSWGAERTELPSMLLLHGITSSAQSWVRVGPELANRYLLPLLANIAVPTLLIRADAALGTTLDDAAWERAKQYLPARSRAVQINGATHNVHRSTFNAFMQVVNDFLSQENGSTFSPLSFL